MSLGLLVGAVSGSVSGAFSYSYGAGDLGSGRFDLQTPGWRKAAGLFAFGAGAKMMVSFLDGKKSRGAIGKSYWMSVARALAEAEEAPLGSDAPKPGNGGEGRIPPARPQSPANRLS